MSAHKQSLIRRPERRPSLHCVSSYSYRFHREHHQHVAKPLKAQSLKWRPKTPSQDIAHKATQLSRWPAHQSASGLSKPEPTRHVGKQMEGSHHVCVPKRKGLHGNCFDPIRAIRLQPSKRRNSCAADPLEGQVSAQVLNGSLPWQWVYILHIEVPTVWKKAPQYWSFQSRLSAEILEGRVTFP